MGRTALSLAPRLNAPAVPTALSPTPAPQYNPIPPATFAKLGERDPLNNKVHIQGSHELANMFQFKRDFEELYCGNRPVALAKKLHPGLKSFEEWAALHKSAFFVSA